MIVCQMGRKTYQLKYTVYRPIVFITEIPHALVAEIQKIQPYYKKYLIA